MDECMACTPEFLFQAGSIELIGFVFLDAVRRVSDDRTERIGRKRCQPFEAIRVNNGRLADLQFFVIHSIQCTDWNLGCKDRDSPACDHCWPLLSRSNQPPISA